MLSLFSTEVSFNFGWPSQYQITKPSPLVFSNHFTTISGHESNHWHKRRRRSRPNVIDSDTPPHASHAPPALADPPAPKCYNTAICKSFPGFSPPCSLSRNATTRCTTCTTCTTAECYHTAICTRFPGPRTRVAATLVSEEERQQYYRQWQKLEK